MAFHVHDGEAFARDALQAIQCVVPAMLSVGAGRGGARVSGACVFLDGAAASVRDNALLVRMRPAQSSFARRTATR